MTSQGMKHVTAPQLQLIVHMTCDIEIAIRFAVTGKNIETPNSQQNPGALYMERHLCATSFLCALDLSAPQSYQPAVAATSSTATTQLVKSTCVQA